MSVMEISAVSISVISAAITLLGLLVKRGTSADAALVAIQKQSAEALEKMREEQARLLADAKADLQRQHEACEKRIQHIEDQMNTLAGFNAQMRDTITDERIGVAELREENSTLRQMVVTMKKRLTRANPPLATESEFPLPIRGG